jgi:hypothetical protein
MALPPWLQIGPTLALQALEAGTQAGNSIAQRRQQAAQFEAAQAAESQQQAQRFAQSAAAAALEDAYRRSRDVTEDERAAEALRLKRDESAALRDYRSAGIEARQGALDLREKEFNQRLLDREAKTEAERALNRRLAEALSTGASIIDLAKEDPSLVENPLAEQLVRNELIAGRSKGSRRSVLSDLLGQGGGSTTTNAPPQPFRIRSVR